MRVKKEGKHKIWIGAVCFLAVALIISIATGIGVINSKTEKIEQIYAREKVLLDLILLDEPPDISHWHVREIGYADLDADGNWDYIGKEYEDSHGILNACAIYNMLDIRDGEPTLFLLEIFGSFYPPEYKHEKELRKKGYCEVIKIWRRSPEDKMELLLGPQKRHARLLDEWKILKENEKLKVELRKIK